jgi:hypothetical protein
LPSEASAAHMEPRRDGASDLLSVRRSWSTSLSQHPSSALPVGLALLCSNGDFPRRRVLPISSCFSAARSRVLPSSCSWLMHVAFLPRVALFGALFCHWSSSAAQKEPRHLPQLKGEEPRTVFRSRLVMALCCALLPVALPGIFFRWLFRSSCRVFRCHCCGRCGIAFRRTASSCGDWSPWVFPRWSDRGRFLGVCSWRRERLCCHGGKTGRLAFVECSLTHTHTDACTTHTFPPHFNYEYY